MDQKRKAKIKGWAIGVSIVIALIALIYGGCQTELGRKMSKHVESGYSGLERKVTLFDCGGGVIQSWRGEFMVELTRGGVSWIDENNLEIKIFGIIVVEEIEK